MHGITLNSEWNVCLSHVTNRSQLLTAKLGLGDITVIVVKHLVQDWKCGTFQPVVNFFYVLGFVGSSMGTL